MSLFAAIKSLFGFKSEGRTASPKDRWLVCEDCQSKFVFDEGEQKFFKEKGFTDPKRCPRCRKKVRFRMRKKGGRGGGSDHNNHNQHQNNRSGQRHRHRGGRHHSVIDGDSPYADER